MWELTKSFRFEAAHALPGTTLGESLSRFIWDRVQSTGGVTRVSVHRDSCNESCTYFGPQT